MVIKARPFLRRVRPNSKLSFAPRGSRVLVVCQPDRFANSVKPSEIADYLKRRHGIDVAIFSTVALGRLGKGRLSGWLPSLRAREWPLYFCELMHVALGVSPKVKIRAKKWRSLLLYAILRLRGSLVADLLRHEPYDLVICESNLDASYVLHGKVSGVQMLDLPCPWADELLYAREIDQSGFERISQLERAGYERADYLSFHWHTYVEYVKKNRYDGPNFFPLSYGAHRKQLRAQFSQPPRIVFLGLLHGEWVNLPLLERLCALYPHIDLYGGPRPPQGLQSHYRGYTPSLDVLANYQFGLITISDDPLRQSSFSSKHLEYISYGLPVLTPEWRHDSLLEPSAISYTEERFLECLESHSTRETWTAKSQAALELSNSLTWASALAPLDELVRDIPPIAGAHPTELDTD